jgi:small subunit ribosomal protein S6
VLVRVELVAGGRGDGLHLVALQGRVQLAQRGVGAFAQLLGRLAFLMARPRPGCRTPAAGFRQSSRCRTCGPWRLVLGAAAGVLGLGLGTQELVGQIGALGLEFGQLGLQPGQFVDALAARAASSSSGLIGPPGMAWCWFSGWSDIRIRVDKLEKKDVASDGDATELFKPWIVHWIREAGKAGSPRVYRAAVAIIAGFALPHRYRRSGRLHPKEYHASLRNHFVDPSGSKRTGSAMLERYKGMITAGGGKVHRVEDWGRRQLAYLINKLAKAHYLCLNIEADQAVMAELEHAFKFNDAVLRHLTVKKKGRHRPFVDDEDGRARRSPQGQQAEAAATLRLDPR